MTASLQGSAGSEFNPIITEWFARRYGEPTEVQSRAWPVVAAGHHVLMTAPTGSGKTLAAFLGAINRLVTGQWSPGVLRVLYVSPLKALNNDIRRNLVGPLDELRQAFEDAGEPFPPLRVMTRSGDTPQSERRGMVRRPPEFLITTPESFNLILSSPVARNILSSVKLVILDEIHAVAGSKRGTHLVSAVERLTLLAGEFQRVALSATVRPLERVAAFVGGARDVRIIDAAGKKNMDIRVVFPRRDEDLGNSPWPGVIELLAEKIRKNVSTLIFTNSRRMAEKTARLLNEHFGAVTVYAHHGSLSRELRYLVEEKMKKGELSAVVATGSLELGIDIGSLDEVVCLQTPFSVTEALQRSGRSGHGVGETARVTFCPIHGMDLLSSAVLSPAVATADLEETVIPLNALDVLAQVILSMTAVESWKIDGLYEFLKTCYPWHRLTEGSFNAVLDMLSGRFADTKVHELAPRIILDREVGTVEAKKGVLPVLYLSGGTIPDRGYFRLVLAGSEALIGELDEEFVWERKLGDTFTLGNSTWRVTALDERSVTVVPARRPEAMTPFWRAEPRGRSYLFCRRIREFLDHRPPGEDAFLGSLEHRHRLDPAAAEELLSYLNRQEAAAGALPGLHRIVIEYAGAARQPVIHTFWGWEVNAPFALALERAWKQRYDSPAKVFYTDTCILLDVQGPFTGRDLRDILSPEAVLPLLRKELESTGLFGAVFRENASRALLLPKSTGRKRVPLWLSRRRGKELLEAISRYEDFPVLAETWRSCLEDIFDLPNLLQVLEDLADGTTEVMEVRTAAPSPFAADVFFQHTNYFMYRDDTPEEGAASRLKDDYIRDLVFSAELRPRIPREVIRAFERRIQRIEEGYAPDTATDVLDLVRQRRFMSVDEWKELLKAVWRDHGCEPETLEEELSDRVKVFRFSGGTEDLLAVSAEAKRLSAGLPAADMPALVAEYLSWFGPVSTARLQGVFGLSGEAVENLTGELVEEGDAVPGPIAEGGEAGELCSPRSLEILLRLKRRMARPVFEPLPAAALAPFLAAWSGLTGFSGGEDASRIYEDRLDSLLMYPAEAALWEENVLPARIPGYDPRRLDELVNDTGLLWLGRGKKKIVFAFEEDLELLGRFSRADGGTEVFPRPAGAFSFWDLKDYSGLDSGALSARLWELAWQGKATTRDFEALRRGIEANFRAYGPKEDTRRRSGAGRGGFNRWERSRQVQSLWRPVPVPREPEDLLEGEEIQRERVRALLRRYGIIIRPLTERELPAFRWGKLFSTLRLMEFSGEVVSGIFFHGLSGPQFASPEALRFLEDFSVPEVTWWINAADPASLCGVFPAGGGESLPRRLPSNRLLYRGARLIMTARRNCRELDFHLPPEDPLCLEAAELFRGLAGRAVRPVTVIKTETVNGLPVHDSPYRPVLEALGFERAYRGYTFRRRL